MLSLITKMILFFNVYIIGKHSFKRSNIFRDVINTLDSINRQYLVHNAFCCVIMSRPVTKRETEVKLKYGFQL